jgi:cobalamin biosynthesis protein CobD/CbiB
MSQDNTIILSEIYQALGVTNQLDALNAIADLKTINSSMEAEIHTILNIDFGVQGYYLKNKSTAEKMQMLSIIGKRLQRVTDISKTPELVSIEDLSK